MRERASFLVSARRTYLDRVVRPFLPDDAGRPVAYFYDLNAKANWRATARDRFFVSLYGGEDRFGYSDHSDYGGSLDQTDGRLGRGNLTGALRYSRVVCVTIRLSDPPGPSSYALSFPHRILQPTGEVVVWPLGFRVDDPALYRGDLDEVLYGNEGFLSNRTFDDGAFDGRPLTFDVEAERAPEGEGAYPAETFVRLDALSPRYAEYARARRLAEEAEGNPLAEPVSLPTNVEGGLGIFAGRAGRQVRLPD